VLRILEFPEVQPVCPLPADFAWQFEDGIDFYIYRLVSDTETRSGGGIYFGYYPSFHRTTTLDLVPGRVAGETIVWAFYEVQGAGSSLVGYETVFTYPPHSNIPDVSDPLQLHVWLYAPDQEQLEPLAKSLENLRFEARDSG
jgi:hypothetical protein